MEMSVAAVWWTIAVLLTKEVSCACIPSYYQDNYHTPILHKCTEDTQKYPQSHYCSNYYHHHNEYSGDGSRPASQVCSDYSCYYPEENRECEANCECYAPENQGSYCQTQCSDTCSCKTHHNSDVQCPVYSGYVQSCDTEKTGQAYGCNYQKESHRSSCVNANCDYSAYNYCQCGCHGNKTEEVTTEAPITSSTTVSPTTIQPLTSSTSEILTTTQPTVTASNLASRILLPKISHSWTFPVHPRPEDIIFV